MAAAGMDYPLHLGVTEAGEGQDARIKSAIGIGALLQDGLGDTLRVSLTEDPWFEVPVAKELAERAEKLWARSNSSGAVSGSDDTHGQDARATALAAEWDAAVDPLQYRRRETATVALAEGIAVNADNPPRVVVPTTLPLSNPAAIVRELRAAHAAQKEIRAEALLISVRSMDDVLLLPEVIVAVRDEVPALFIEIPDDLPILADFFLLVAAATPIPLAFVRRFSPTKEDAAYVLRSWLDLAEKYDVVLAVDADAAAVDAFAHQLKAAPPEQLIYTLSAAATAANAADAGHHALGAYRALAESLHRNGLTSPIWIRNTAANAGVANCADALLDASILSGALFCDGLGDLVSIENAPTFDKSLTLAYDILQGARMRASKTEYVACPSCGRTLFDIQSTTQKIKTRTGHLKGVTIAVMGCIVNGPGEMADADFGYVGGAPGKINLYVRRECVKVGLPQDAAVEHLVGLIKEHGKWVEPPPSNLESK
jgi:(E)-4-hydroxy-3-methylbut-2-enyl-diphosphate synthase